MGGRGTLGFNDGSEGFIIRELLDYMKGCDENEGVYVLISRRKNGNYRGRIGHNTIPERMGGLQLDNTYNAYVYQPQPFIVVSEMGVCTAHRSYCKLAFNNDRRMIFRHPTRKRAFESYRKVFFCEVCNPHREEFDKLEEEKK